MRIRLSYITTDNATANDIIIECLIGKLKNYDSIEHRLRYLSYIINLY